MPSIAFCFITQAAGLTPHAWLRFSFRSFPVLCQSLCLTWQAHVECTASLQCRPTGVHCIMIMKTFE